MAYLYNYVSRSAPKNVFLLISSFQNKIPLTPSKSFCTSLYYCQPFKVPEPKRWLTYNEKIFPPQEIGEKPRAAYVCHMKTNLKYSYKKMWYIAVLVRGLQIENALNQLKFVNKKGALMAMETLEEARDLAVKKHNVEFASNLWVAESFVGKGYVVKGLRRHARGRMGEIRYSYIHYFVRLEEGEPPEHYYYWNQPRTPQEKLDSWLKEKRERTIDFTI